MTTDSQRHPTAIIASGAELADDVVVGPYAVIEGTRFGVCFWLSAAASVLSASVRCQVAEREDSESAERQQWVETCLSACFRHLELISESP